LNEHEYLAYIGMNQLVMIMDEWTWVPCVHNYVSNWLWYYLNEYEYLAYIGKHLIARWTDCSFIFDFSAITSISIMLEVYIELKMRI
jgi:hypothetical protein